MIYFFGSFMADVWALIASLAVILVVAVEVVAMWAQRGKS